MELLPWWVYVVIVGIVISGFMVIFTEKKEQEVDNEYIENEGDVYIKRMEKEREQRLQGNKKDVEAKL